MNHEKAVSLPFRVNALFGTGVSTGPDAGAGAGADAFSGASFAVPLAGFDPSLIRPQAMDANFGFVPGGEPAGIGSGLVAS